METLLKETTIRKIHITLWQLDEGFEVRWDGLGGLKSHNNHLADTLEKAQSYFAEWSNLAKVQQ
jgi:hypothetical protein